MKILAIDQGTTSTRGLITQPGGQPAICAAFKHAQLRPAEGWVEHDPREILANIREVIRLAGPVDVIGLTNQGESCMAWDAITGTPLSPIIVWQDNRTIEEIERLRTPCNIRLVKQRSGLSLDPYFSASKIRWLIENLPEVSQALDKGRLHIGTTDSYFIEQLTGVYATDVSTASRTSLMSLASCQWDADLCHLFKVPMDVLPEIRPTVGDFGRISNVPVRASVVDQQASLFGHGCHRRGDAKITFGTGAFALAISDQKGISDNDTPLSATVAWQIGHDTSYALEGGVYDASAAVEWSRRLGLFDDYSELAVFESIPAIARSLAFVPALSGLACPFWDRSASAMWIGMNGGTSRQDMCQAVLEGIALRSAQIIDEMNLRIPIGKRISVDGGLTRSSYFVQFLANVLEREIVTQRFDEITALGCAGLAAFGMGSGLDITQDHHEIYKPNIDKNTVEEWKKTFARAVENTKGWHRQTASLEQ